MPFEAIVPDDFAKPIAPYSPGARAGRVIYTSGVLPLDPSGQVVHVDDAAAQTRFVLESIRSIVTAAGGAMTDIAFNAIFLADWNDYAAMNAVYAEYFPGEKPARYCVQSGLAKKSARVEIAATAHLPD
jgi:aminoacrylate peracid reductase